MKKYLKILLVLFGILLINTSFSSTNPYSSYFSSGMNKNLDNFILKLQIIKNDVGEEEFDILLDTLRNKLTKLKENNPNNELVLNLVGYFLYEMGELPKREVVLGENKLVIDEEEENIEEEGFEVDGYYEYNNYQIGIFNSGEYIIDNDKDYDLDGEIEGCYETIDGYAYDIDYCILYDVEREYYISPYKDERVMSLLKEGIYCDQLEVGNMKNWSTSAIYYLPQGFNLSSTYLYLEKDLIKYNKEYPYYALGRRYVYSNYSDHSTHFYHRIAVNLNTGDYVHESSNIESSYGGLGRLGENPENIVRCIYKKSSKFDGSIWGKKSDNYYGGYYNWGYDYIGEKYNIEDIAENDENSNKKAKQINISINGEIFKIDKFDTGEYVLWDNIDYDGDGEIEGCYESIGVGYDIDNCILYNYTYDKYISPYSTDLSGKTFSEAQEYCSNLEIGNWQDWTVPYTIFIAQKSDLFKYRASGYYYSNHNEKMDNNSIRNTVLIMDAKKAISISLSGNYESNNVRCIRTQQVHHEPCLADACSNTIFGAGEDYRIYDGKIYSNTLWGGGRYIVNNETDYDGDGKVEGCLEDLEGYDKNKCTLYIKDKNLYIYADGLGYFENFIDNPEIKLNDNNRLWGRKLGIVEYLEYKELFNTNLKEETGLEYKISGIYYDFSSKKYILNSDKDYDGDGKMEGCEEDIEGRYKNNCVLHDIDNKYYIAAAYQDYYKEYMEEDMIEYCKNLELPSSSMYMLEGEPLNDRQCIFRENDCGNLDKVRAINTQKEGCNSEIFPIVNAEKESKGNIHYICKGKWTVDTSGDNFDLDCETGWIKTGLENERNLLKIESCKEKGTKILTDTYYGGCDSPDMIICYAQNRGYIISGCNVGTTVGGTGVESYGDYFEWGRNKGFKLDENGEVIGGITGQEIKTELYDENNDTYPFVYHGYAPQNNNYSWLKLNEESKKYNFWGYQSEELSEKQGPCEEGYHVPNNKEWENLIRSRLSEFGYEEEYKKNISEDLQLPMAGRISGYDGKYLNEEVDGNYTAYYWSLGVELSSNYEYSGINNKLFFTERDGINFNWYNTDFVNSINRAKNGLPVRCFKNEY